MTICLAFLPYLYISGTYNFFITTLLNNAAVRIILGNLSSGIIARISIPAIFFRQVMVAGFPDVEWLELATRYLAIGWIIVSVALTFYSGVVYVIRAARILGAEEE